MPAADVEFGMSKSLQDAQDGSPIIEKWAEKYGPAFQIPIAIGGNQFVLCDPKAFSHFYSKETYKYVQNPTLRMFIEHMVRRLSWSPS